MTDIPPQSPLPPPQATYVYQAPPPSPPKPGFVSGIVACCLGVIGIVMPVVGFFFTMAAAVVALVSTLRSIFGRCMAGFGMAMLAWLMVAIGCATSLVFLGLVGQHIDKKNGSVSRWIENNLDKHATEFGDDDYKALKEEDKKTEGSTEPNTSTSEEGEF